MANEFRFSTTDDGSPTLEMYRSDGTVEKMHNFRGAFSETIYVYGEALKIALDHGFAPRFFSLGLGLGYVELMVAAAVLARGLEGGVFTVPTLSDASDAAKVALWTYEIEECLKAPFLDWLYERTEFGAGGDPIARYSTAYDWILAKMAETFGVAAAEVKKTLRDWHRDGRWHLQGAYSVDSDFGGTRFSVLFYDAFSNKMSPELWDLTALIHTLKAGADDRCVFATYAAKGRLNRLLVECGFTDLRKPGYGGKRECTLAVRGVEDVASLVQGHSEKA